MKRLRFAGAWRLIDLGNVIRWMRPVDYDQTHRIGQGLFAMYMGQWMLIGPIVHDRFPTVGCRA